jgi:hypothetical protein
MVASPLDGTKRSCVGSSKKGRGWLLDWSITCVVRGAAGLFRSHTRICLWIGTEGKKK